jgi:hypothetical protein
MNDTVELPPEGMDEEKARLSRECRAMYDDLAARGAITGTYAEWLEAAAKEAAERLEPKPAEKPLVQVVSGAFRQ